MTRVFVTAVLGMVAALISVPEALGHGPCGCTGPAFLAEDAPEVEAVPGDRLLIMQAAVEVVWNPKGFGYHPPPEIANNYVPGAATVTLARSKTPQQQVVRVPDVPGGRYLMVIYDGSEGGQHYTWDHVQVSEFGSSASTAPSTGGRDWPWIVLAAAIGLALGWLASLRRRRRSGT